MKSEVTSVSVRLVGQEATVSPTSELVKIAHVRTMPSVSISSKITSAFVHLELMVNNVKQLQNVALETLVCMEDVAKTLDPVLTAHVRRTLLVLVVNMNMTLAKRELVKMELLVQTLEALSSVCVHLDLQESTAMKILLIVKKIHVHLPLLALI